jgi:hypothetical protein
MKFYNVIDKKGRFCGLKADKNENTKRKSGSIGL